MEQFAQLYIKEIVRLHGVPVTIVSDRDPRYGPYEALYGRKCRSPIHWDEVGENRILGPKIIERTVEAADKIRARIKTAQDRQKSYADSRRKDLEFSVGDKVFLKVAPMKGVLRFGKKGKLRRRFIGPFEILERIGVVAYQLALPPKLAAVHNVFHISMLRKYVHDPNHVISYQTVDVQRDLSYEETPMMILDRKLHQLRNKEVSLVKVQWQNHGLDESAWEKEELDRVLLERGGSMRGCASFAGRGFIILTNLLNRGWQRARDGDCELYGIFLSSQYCHNLRPDVSLDAFQLLNQLFFIIVRCRFSKRISQHD
ncbi:uncharacterized protein LOC111375452 [Olea europaea var. sylvestris]|uniref:uncharacterized protein LOC111375452 n=1 Tax=Olea europaea var. sylvestris TaxID=158386 RepID=UPI000C1D7B08|nr:uncharacterized protein LOC111375452 [Olea europaea var. sylvestris]